MWQLVLLLWWLGSIWMLSRLLSNNLKKEQEKLEALLQKVRERQKEICEVNSRNQSLHDLLLQKLAIYEVTKRLCSSLVAEEILGHFKQVAGEYLSLQDCWWTEDIGEYQGRADIQIVKFVLGEKILGYLVAVGLEEKMKDKFHILSQQLLLAMRRAVLYQQMQELAIRDMLTGLNSRRYVLERFAQEIERSQRFGYPLAVLMIDIDHFKFYNDQYGHRLGDMVLRQIAEVIRATTRQVDIIGRYGGEEFLVILAETSQEGAKLAAERIRLAVEKAEVGTYEMRLKATVSIGVAVFPRHGLETKTLIDYADMAMYAAKRAGRNRVAVYGESI